MSLDGGCYYESSEESQVSGRSIYANIIPKFWTPERWIMINNIVLFTDLQCDINLRQLTLQCSDIIYNPKTFVFDGVDDTFRVVVFCFVLCQPMMNIETF